MNKYLFGIVTNVAVLAFVAFMVCTGHSAWWAVVLLFLHYNEK